MCLLGFVSPFIFRSLPACLVRMMSTPTVVEPLPTRGVPRRHSRMLVPTTSNPRPALALRPSLLTDGCRGASRAQRAGWLQSPRVEKVHHQQAPRPGVCAAPAPPGAQARCGEWHAHQGACAEPRAASRPLGRAYTAVVVGGMLTCCCLTTFC